MNGIITNIIKKHEPYHYGIVESYIYELNEEIRFAEEEDKYEVVGRQFNGELWLGCESYSIIENQDNFVDSFTSIDTGNNADAYSEIKGTVYSLYWFPYELHIYIMCHSTLLEVYDLHKYNPSLRPGAKICAKCWTKILFDLYY